MFKIYALSSSLGSRQKKKTHFNRNIEKFYLANSCPTYDGVEYILLL